MHEVLRFALAMTLLFLASSCFLTQHTLEVFATVEWSHTLFLALRQLVSTLHSCAAPSDLVLSEYRNCPHSLSWIVQSRTCLLQSWRNSWPIVRWAWKAWRWRHNLFRSKYLWRVLFFSLWWILHHMFLTSSHNNMYVNTYFQGERDTRKWPCRPGDNQSYCAINKRSRRGNKDGNEEIPRCQSHE